MKKSELLDAIRESIQTDCMTISEEMQDCNPASCLETVAAAVERLRVLTASYSLITRMTDKCPGCGYPTR